jgi:hypothetical protein
MSDIAAPYLPCRTGIRHLCTASEPADERSDEHLRRPDCHTGPNHHSQFWWDSSRESIALEAAHMLSGTAKDTLLAYAMTGSAMSSVVIVAASHFELLLRCIFHGRG